MKKAPTKPKPAAKSAKASAKPRAPKAAAAKPKAKATAKRAKQDSEDEDSDAAKPFEASDRLSHTPPSAKKPKKTPVVQQRIGAKPLREVENEAIQEAIEASMVDEPAKGNKPSDQYQRLTQLEHIIKRPDTYIGSVEMQDKQMWVYNSELESMELRTINFVPGLYKIFDEILVNAADNKQRDKNMDAVKVTINRESGEISVYNNGRGIPIEMHEKEGIYIPEMIFGHLLTSSNYDDDQEKVTGGRNGYGAKLCNVFSTKFTLETCDSHTKQKYKQTWTANMSKMGTASITAQKGGDDYTKISFVPDYKKFKMTGIDDDLEALLKRRVHDLAGTSKGVKVWLNGERIKAHNFKKYMEMYTKAIKRERGDEAVNDVSDIITDTPDVRWEIGFAVSDGTFQQVSFVNSIATTSGGTHVNYIADQVSNKLLEIVKKKKNNKAAALKVSQIRNHIFIFVNCLIVNPAFTSQTKEQLTTKASQFGSKCVLSDEFMKKIAKTDVVENILHFAEQKADQILKKSDGSRRSRIDNPKLTDANRAGTKDGYKCTLILTEGDSAKGMALAGRSIISSDYFGVYPLRGKLLNVRDASIDQISKNQEIQNIKNFLGLKHKQSYDDCKSLRYGHLMIMTDQDHDGSHIKGLLINFLQVQYPSLLRIPEFLMEFITPIVKVYKGDPKRPRASHFFFTMPEYQRFKDTHQGEHWEHKYYKGLGTSHPLETQAYFRDLDKHLKEFDTMKDHEPELIELAFSKKKADERKEWLRQCKPGTYLDHASSRSISYTDFVNKELILFSVADNQRSIPSVIDGFKPGQRKVLFTCFARNLKKDMKVVELAGCVSGLTAYQHGEASLQGTIVGLAQNFVGTNNINCLEPSGNFGSRLQGGSDHASPRYIYTRLSPFARAVFNPADEPLLTYNTDDEKQIEPEAYVPVVPMILINGADGIGTGWSSSIPNYNPEDIVENLKLMMDGESPKTMTPWFRDFKGQVTQMGPDKYKFSGIVEQTGNLEVSVQELPIRTWTQDFKDRIVDVMKAEKTPSWIKDYDDYNTERDVNFVIKMEDKFMKAALEEGLEERFKLSKTLSTTNLVAFDSEGRIAKYASVEDMLKEFFTVRLKFYEKRKAHQLSVLQNDLDKYTNQARFVQMIIDGKLVVSKKRKEVLVQELKEKGFKSIQKTANAIKQGELGPMAEPDEEEAEEEERKTGASCYEYLLGMPIWSLTKERVERLLKQVGDVELTIDALIKLSREDLWRRDLDAFLETWRFELEEDRKTMRQMHSKGRRASNKLRIGGTAGRKRKDSDDSDFEAPAKAKKGKPTGIAAVLNEPAIVKEKKLTAKPKLSAKPLKETAAQKFAKGRQTSTVDLDEDDVWMQIEDVKPRGRQTAKPVKYAIDDSDSDGDDMLLNVGKMVKGIDSAAAQGRPLFSGTTVSQPAKVAETTQSRVTTTLSPAAKAYAAKRAKGSLEGDVKKIEPLDGDGDEIAAPRPARRAATASKKTTTWADSEEEEETMDYEDSE